MATMGIASLGIKPGYRVASGQLVDASCTFSVSGVNTNPTTVIARYRYVTASATTAQFPTASTADAWLLRDSTGVYHFDFTAISAGTYYVRFEGTSACVAAEEGYFDCITSRF